MRFEAHETLHEVRFLTRVPDAIPDLSKCCSINEILLVSPARNTLAKLTQLQSSPTEHKNERKNLARVKTCATQTSFFFANLGAHDCSFRVQSCLRAARTALMHTHKGWRLLLCFAVLCHLGDGFVRLAFRHQICNRVYHVFLSKMHFVFSDSI